MNHQDHLPNELRAPAKLNLGLYLGPARPDGLHELASIFEPLSLHDRITVSEADRDEVICPGVTGRNLAAEALRLLRSEGWNSPPLRIEIEKRIPVQAGLGGGSADAAAVLRLALGEVADLAGLAIMLGADVPSQIDSKPCLVEGVGQKLSSLPPLAEHWIVLVPFAGGLSTAEVFAEADRQGAGRAQEEINEISGKLWAVASNGVSPLEFPALLVNDLEPAAVSLKPEIGAARQRVEAAGAGLVAISGSGPTVFGIYPDRESAEAGAGEIGPEAIVCRGGAGL
ncbi:MAG: 4-(cytidine 5'-diphospho)-2-C-methyl-D-erythritol kinase [Acidobacteriota bacterium]